MVDVVEKKPNGIEKGGNRVFLRKIDAANDEVESSIYFDFPKSKYGDGGIVSVEPVAFSEEDIFFLREDYYNGRGGVTVDDTRFYDVPRVGSGESVGNYGEDRPQRSIQMKKVSHLGESGDSAVEYIGDELITNVDFISEGSEIVARKYSVSEYGHAFNYGGDLYIPKVDSSFIDVRDDESSKEFGDLAESEAHLIKLDAFENVKFGESDSFSSSSPNAKLRSYGASKDGKYFSSGVRSGVGGALFAPTGKGMVVFDPLKYSFGKLVSGDSFSPDRAKIPEKICTASDGDPVKSWCMRGVGKVALSRMQDNLLTITNSYDGEYSADDIFVYDIDSGEEVYSVGEDVLSGQGIVWASAAGKSLFLLSDDGAAEIDLENGGAERRGAKGHSGQI
ncbi:hypothetical protein [Corynebacterium oculi]|uniref:hypothetical protein n=1 Tax=Corynebacterium oculi TaxID=1544416 RepID=UPI000AB44318|nr:hypothetical protein [Corynebacterium oculi]